MSKPSTQAGFKLAGQRMGLRLRKVRQQQGKSLEALAAKVGVNKLTLGNIERGEGNPTLSVIWKIANGLGVPFSSLLSHDTPPQVSRFTQQADISSPDGNFLAHAMLDMQEQCTFDVQIARVEAGNHYQSEAHAEGVIELVCLIQGELEVNVDGDSYVLQPLDCLRFCADQSHSYFNPGQSEAIFHCIIAYRQLSNDKAHNY
ncbi:XRE family transcriptional regulator [Oceanospirillaceae bacterium]|nr:XRE family transcriptional regulator [Oceanospirillaceae bacterium]